MGQHKLNPFARGSSVPPPTGIQDAYGRPLEPGDEVVFHMAVAPRARIQGIRHVLDPGAPPGLVQVMLRSDWILTFKAGQPVIEMLRVQTVAEAIDRGILKRVEPAAAPAGENGAQPVEDPPTNQ